MQSIVAEFIRPVVLSIAGFDPGMGAGTGADQRAVESCKCAFAAVCAVQTVQNSLGMTGAFPASRDVFEKQLDALFDDVEISAVKIGALGNSPLVSSTSAILKRRAAKNIVLDPVLASTSGGSLIDSDAVETLLTQLCPVCDLITPNLDELKILTGIDVARSEEAQKAADRLFEFGVKAVLVKGGHMEGDPVDTLFRIGRSPLSIGHARIETPHTHGTGCFLSSSIASLLARGFDLDAASRKAIAHLCDALSTPATPGKGRGYPFPASNPAVRQLTRDPRISGIYFVTSADFGCSHEESALAALEGGVKAIQFRGKDMDTGRQVEVAGRIQALCKKYGALFLVNDRVDVAIASGADGAHVGGHDMSASKAREILGPAAILGSSVATIPDGNLALPYVDYFGVGAVYGSTTKLDAGGAIGPERLTLMKNAFPDMPIVAIGGIGAANLGEVKRAGANSAAVISAIAGVGNRAVAAKELVKLWKKLPEM